MNIEENKSRLLKNYKNLIVCYEKIIKEYDNSYSSEPQIIKCSRIIADNKAWVTTKWQLISTSGEVLYTSSYYALEQSWVQDLNGWIIPTDMVFFLKANVKSGDDSVSSVYLEYDPTSNYTAYFQLTGTAFNTTLKYIE